VSVDRHNQPYKAAGAVLLVAAALAAGFVYALFRGDLATTTQLTLLSSRAGLVVEPGAKVTFNGVEIGRVSRINAVDDGDGQQAELILDVGPRYLEIIPANVSAEIRATTVFGNKYISFSSRMPSRNVFRLARSSTPRRSPRSSTRCSRRSPRSPSRWTR
jgi:phospholipid/cholesterol/gamma-HCH transport system substrate-binding protein